MAGTLDLRVLNPAETLLEVQEAAWVHLRLADGTGITIYPGHAPLLAETVTAPLRYADDAGEHVYNVEAGILQVKRDDVRLFTSGESELETPDAASLSSEEHKFERLARELRQRLHHEEESALRRVFELRKDHE